MNKAAMAIVVVIALVAVGGGAFYAGTRVGAQRVMDNPALLFQQSGLGQRGQFRFVEGTPEGGLEGRPTFGGGSLARGEGFQMPGGGVMGTIEGIEGTTLTLSTDSTSLQVLTAETTLIQKTMNVSVGELEVGEQVVVSGTENEDGTMTARSIRSMRGIQMLQSEQ